MLQPCTRVSDASFWSSRNFYPGAAGFDDVSRRGNRWPAGHFHELFKIEHWVRCAEIA